MAHLMVSESLTQGGLDKTNSDLANYRAHLESLDLAFKKHKHLAAELQVIGDGLEREVAVLEERRGRLEQEAKEISLQRTVLSLAQAKAPVRVKYHAQRSRPQLSIVHESFPRDQLSCSLAELSTRACCREALGLLTTDQLFELYRSVLFGLYRAASNLPLPKRTCPPAHLTAAQYASYTLIEWTRQAAWWGASEAVQRDWQAIPRSQYATTIDWFTARESVRDMVRHESKGSAWNQIVPPRHRQRFDLEESALALEAQRVASLALDTSPELDPSAKGKLAFAAASLAVLTQALIHVQTHWEQLHPSAPSSSRH